MDENGTTRLLRLVALVQDGDQGAINDLLMEYRDRFVFIAHRMLGSYPDLVNRVQTDDVVQNASIRLARALKDSVVQDKLLTRGHTKDLIRLAAEMIRRELLDLAKYYRVRRETPLSSDPPAGSSWEPGHLGDWETFQEVVASLPEELREVFDLRYYNDFPTAVAARRLDISVRTVQLRWMKALQWIADECKKRMAEA